MEGGEWRWMAGWNQRTEDGMGGGRGKILTDTNTLVIRKK
jgi:hypothetical protein